MNFQMTLIFVAACSLPHIENNFKEHEIESKKTKKKSSLKCAFNNLMIISCRSENENSLKSECKKKKIERQFLFKTKEYCSHLI